MADPHFSQVDIHYNTAFDTGAIINPVDAARRILAADFAGGFLNYATGEEEIAHAFREGTAFVEKMFTIQEVLSELESAPSLKSYFRLVRAAPRTSIPVIVRSLLGQLNHENGEGADAQEDADDEDPVAETMTAAREFALTILGRLAVQEAVDRTTFHEDYLEALPFVRVSLQPFDARIYERDLSFTTVLTIHRTGIAVLSAHVCFTGGMTLEELISLQRPSRLPYSRCELPTTILNRYLSLFFGALSDNDLESFNREVACEERPSYSCFEVDEGQSPLAALFDAYRYAITEHIQEKRYESIDAIHRSLRSPQYFGHHVMFLQHPDVLESDAFRRKHSRFMTKLVMGLPRSIKLREDKVREVCEGDIAVTTNRSFYLTEAGAVLFYFGADQEEPRSDCQNADWLGEMFLTTGVLDILIFQRMILRVYQELLKKVTLDETGLIRLNEIKRELLLALDEYDALDLSHYGSVHEMIKKGQEALRITDLYRSFEQRVETIEGLAQVAANRIKERQERLSKVMVTIVSVLLSLPVAANIIEVVTGWSPRLSGVYPPWFRAPFAWLIEQTSDHPTRATLILYALIFFATLVAFWSGSFIRILKRRRAMPSPPKMKSNVHVRSPISISVELADAEASEGNRGRGDA